MSDERKKDSEAPEEDTFEETVREPSSPAGEEPEEFEQTTRAPRPVDAGMTLGGTLEGSAQLTRFVLFPLNGAERGKPFAVPAPQCMIGSSPSCAVVLHEAESVHAKIVAEDGGFAIINVGTPGSVVLEGGRTVTKATLKSGDLIKIGGAVVRFARLGDVFPSQYDEKAFDASVLANLGDRDFWKAHRSWLVIGALVLFGALLFLWPRGEPAKVVTTAQSDHSEQSRAKEIASLLAVGEALFQQGRLMPPPDRPDEPNAFAKFNEVLALDPGNKTALDYMHRIDEKREEMRRAAAEAERRRAEEERAAREAKRQQLAAEVAKALEEGDKLFKAGHVVQPPGKNALARYRDGLKIDPESEEARERIGRVVQYYVDQGDALRDKDDLWSALENYRKAAKITEVSDPDVAKRIEDAASRLRSTMSATVSRVVMYKDEKGRLFVVDDEEKVPARYKDRAVVVEPQEPTGSGVR